MKINLNSAYGHVQYKKLSLYDFIQSKPIGSKTAHKSLDRIADVKPGCMAGTKCKGSIPLRNFWNFIKKDKFLKCKGYSTNKDGYGNCFLKSKANMPISTSYVHDCSVMYLYNKDTNTHAMYHAVSACPYKTLQFILHKLMPEGFTKGAIIPGDYIFYNEHKRNMKNMFKLLKTENPDVVINVYNSISRYPEITGLHGNVYEIPNADAKMQMRNGVWDIDDHGQATFRILNLQNVNTFGCIKYNCQTFEELDELEEFYHSQKYPKEILSVLLQEIEQKRQFLKSIECSKNEDTEIQYERLINSLKGFTDVQREHLLMHELDNIKTKYELVVFYKYAKDDIIKLDNLCRLYQHKVEEIM